MGGWGDCIAATPATLPCLHDWMEVGWLPLPCPYKYKRGEGGERGGSFEGDYRGVKKIEEKQRSVEKERLEEKVEGTKK